MSIWLIEQNYSLLPQQSLSGIPITIRLLTISSNCEGGDNNGGGTDNNQQLLLPHAATVATKTPVATAMAEAQTIQ
jgi:hypothetical protein